MGSKLSLEYFLHGMEKWPKIIHKLEKYIAKSHGETSGTVGCGIAQRNKCLYLPVNDWYFQRELLE